MKNSLKELQLAFLFNEWMEIYHPNKIMFNPTIIEITDQHVVFGMAKHYAQLRVSIQLIEIQLKEHYEKKEN